MFLVYLSNSPRLSCTGSLDIAATIYKQVVHGLSLIIFVVAWVFLDTAKAVEEHSMALCLGNWGMCVCPSYLNVSGWSSVFEVKSVSLILRKHDTFMWFFLFSPVCLLHGCVIPQQVWVYFATLLEGLEVLDWEQTTLFNNGWLSNGLWPGTEYLNALITV